MVLDQHQLRAMNTSGNLLVTACPGSGKSRLLSSKASLLLDQQAARVCAVTFTRDAADELKQRIRSQSHSNPGSRLITGTFHSLALSQLRKIGISIRPISGGEQYVLIRRACDHTPGVRGMSFDDAQKIIDYAKSRLDFAYDEQSPEHKLFASYQQLLAQINAHDFADLLLIAVKKMKAGELPLVDADCLLVDESQDTDAVQFAWVLEHAKAGLEVTIVGDDDQSIYGWRNALGYNGMMRFAKDCNATHVSLDTNYRCAPLIINHATRLIAHNQARVPKNIIANRDLKGQIKILRALDREDEASRIAEIIKTNPDESWGVLARTNRLLDAAEITLRAEGLTLKRVGGGSFWDSVEASTFLTILKGLTGEKGHKGWVGALQWAGISAPIIEGLVEAANVSRKDGWPGLAYACENKHVQAKLNDNPLASKTVKALSVRFGEWNKNLDNGRIRLVLTGVVRWLESSRAKNPNKPIPVLRWAESAIAQMKHSTLKERLRILMVKQLLNNKRDEENPPKIKLMTLHSSKGLEFENVVILACENRICPYPDSDVEEERRLFYVGMTRACNNLYLSFTDSNDTPSPFLTEAGLGASR